jgi:hypothetical protein
MSNLTDANELIHLTDEERDYFNSDYNWQEPSTEFFAERLNAARAELAALKAGIAALDRYELRANYWEDDAAFVRAADLQALLN